MLSPKQKRFLVACREEPTVTRAARLAGVSRTSVYRWLAEPEFVAAREAALGEFFGAHRAKVLAAEAARAAWRAACERAHWPMRCHVLALTRAARRRQAP